MTITHRKVSSGTVNANVEVDLSNWNEAHIGNLPVTQLDSGTNASATTFWRGDGTWAAGGGTPGGSNTQVQYNNAGVFAGITGATTNGAILTLTTPDIGAATGQTVVLIGGNSGVLQNTGTAGEFTVGMQTTTSGVKRSVHIFGSDVGTSAGTNVAGNNGLATIWAVGNGSSFLGGAYDATLTIYQTSNLYRFCNGAGTGPGAGVMTLSAAGNLSMVALTVAPQGRITLTTATAIMTSSVAAATTVYYTPAGNLVPIFDGTNWAMKTFSQLSQLTTDTTKSPAAVANNSNYDLFVWSDAGTLRCTRGPAWTSDIVRGTGAGTTELDFTTTFPTNKNAITNGPGANLGTWVGTIRSNGTASIDFVLPTVASGGGQGKIGVWNAYNRAPLDVFIGDNAASTYNYAVATTWRESAGSTTNQINCVRGLDVDTVDALNLTRVALSNVLTTAASSIGLDSTTAPAANASSDIMTSTTSFALALHSTFSGLMGLGWHYLSSIEWNSDTNASTWVRFATPSMQAGMKARLWY